MVTARAGLNRRRVLVAAVALADREGVEALTVRRLAEDLDVHPTSLYNHVPGKAAILDGVVDVLFTEIAVAPEGTDWQDWVRGLARDLRGLARAHPGAFMVLARRPAENQAAYRLAERGIAAFRGAGFPLVQAVLAVRGVSLALLGLALNECPPMGDWVDPGTDGGGWHEHALLREAAAALRPEDDDAHWELVVDALVAGLRPAQ